MVFAVKRCLCVLSISCFERSDNRGESAVEDGLDIVPVLFDAVVGHPVLGIIVGTDFFRTVAGTDLAFPGGGLFFSLFFLGQDQ